MDDPRIVLPRHQHHNGVQKDTEKQESRQITGFHRTELGRILLDLKQVNQINNQLYFILFIGLIHTDKLSIRQMTESSRLPLALTLLLVGYSVSE